ncbi:MAG: HAMP domain-containing histidine kinase [Candidatus Omnitrophica bacterium]|nr:HAMP domain-containing histidine kinase [Candidatus Omnitrophota bacterium]
MNLKIISIFILAIFIPTSLLAYFGFLAVRSEKGIVERNMVQKYKAMADVVEGQIKDALSRAPAEALADNSYWESLLAAQAAIFKDETAVFDLHGRRLGDMFSPKEEEGGGGHIGALSEAVFSRRLAGLPYIVGVYERYPLILEQLEKRRQWLVFYVGLIVFSAVSILAGSFYALAALAREWRLARLKSEFVAHLSHDLRRPLTSIQMFSEMLKEGHVPGEEKKQEYYQIISDESGKLTHLANNILDFSRIERGRIKYNFQLADVPALARDTVERFRTYMTSEKRPVVLNADPCPAVKVDANALAQALMNLLTNAAKYSPAGTEIKVNVKVESRKEKVESGNVKAERNRLLSTLYSLLSTSHKSIVIEVVDRGYGIPAAEQKKIFRKFYRVARDYVAQTEGSGLGLTLVQYAIEAHGGKVFVESEEGKGSKFSIVLPV